MTQENWRIKKAERLEELYKKLRSTAHEFGNELNDWTLVISFYSALHYSSAVLAITHKEESFDSHSKRNAILRKSYRAIWKDYRILSDFSHLVRYQKTLPTASELDEVDKTFRNLVRFCRRKLGIPA